MVRIRSIGFTLVELLVVVSVIAVLAAILFPVFGGTKEQGKMAVCASNLRQIGSAFALYVDAENGRFPAGCRLAAPNEQLHPEQQPGVVTWDIAIYRYVRDVGVFRCPSDAKVRPRHVKTLTDIVPSARSYSLNDQPLVDALIFTRDKNRLRHAGTWTLSEVKDPSKHVLVAECHGRRNYVNEGGYKLGAYRFNYFGWGECYSLVDHTSTEGAHTSGATLNCLFFDGHVVNMSTDTLREPEYWGYLQDMGYDRVVPGCPLEE